MNRSKNHTAFLAVFCFLFILPVAIFSSERGGSPIDLVPSDFLIGLTVVAAIFSKKFYINKKLAKLQLLFVVYAFCLTTIASLLIADFTLYFSFAKFCKVFLAFFAGQALAEWFGRDAVLRALASAAFLYLLILPFSQFVYHAQFTPRLGSHFFELPVYGFPNSPSSYLVFLLCIALAQNRAAYSKALLITVVSIFALGSLSRAAALMFLIAFFAFALNTPRRLLATAGAAVPVLALSVGLDLHSALGIDEIFDGIARRVEATEQSGDLTNGRLEIFDLAFRLIADRPVFGYGFRSFSDFAFHGTPHNQYLEVWFKAGLVGLVLYLLIIFIATKTIRDSAENMPRDLSAGPYVVMIALTLIGNFVQPNLSYSMTGNLIFLVIGLFTFSPQKFRNLEFNRRDVRAGSLTNA